MQKEFDEAFEEWPLPHENNPAINAGMLWAAAQQLKVRSTGHVGVHNVLYFLERCHLRDASQQGVIAKQLAP